MFGGLWASRGHLDLLASSGDWRYWADQTIYDWLRDDMSGGKANELLPASGPTVDTLCKYPSLSLSTFEGGQTRAILLSVQEAIVDRPLALALKPLLSQSLGTLLPASFCFTALRLGFGAVFGRSCLR